MPTIFPALLLIALVATSASAQTVWERANAATVRLEPSRFPALPSALRSDLERRGCRIPQVSSLLIDPGPPHNVIQGAFAASGRKDFAVLCSIRDTSRVLLYRENASTPHDSLARNPDDSFLQAFGEGRIAFSRMIGASPATLIRRLHAQLVLPRDAIALPADANHDGINDAYVGKASMIHYFHSGRWLLLYGAD